MSPHSSCSFLTLLSLWEGRGIMARFGGGETRERDVMGGLLGTTQGFLRMRQILGCLENFSPTLDLVNKIHWTSETTWRETAQRLNVEEKMEPNYDPEQFTAGSANCTLRSKTNSPYILLIGSILSLFTCRLESAWWLLRLALCLIWSGWARG